MVDAALPLLMLRAVPFICWISKVIFSVLSSSRIFVVAVGSRASTVNVQSSWFCSNLLRRLEEVERQRDGKMKVTWGRMTNTDFSLAIRSLLILSLASLRRARTY